MLGDVRIPSKHKIAGAFWVMVRSNSDNFIQVYKMRGGIISYEL